MMRSEQLPRTTAILAVATVVAMSLAACKSDDSKPPVPPTTVTVTTEAQTPTVTATETITPSEDPTVTSTATYVRTAKVAPPEPTTTERQLATDNFDGFKSVAPIKNCVYQGVPIYSSDHQFDCATAVKIFTEYDSRARAEGGGNTLFLQIGQWACSSPTAASSEEHNISTDCDNMYTNHTTIYVPVDPSKPVKPF